MKYSLEELSEYGIASYGKLRVITFGDESRIIIGKYCAIAGEVNAILQAEHRPDWVTTYPFNIKRRKRWPEVKSIKGHPHTKGDIVIGNDVWIGWGATLMSGITIGHGACIGAYSVVTKDVLPYRIAAGNPAKMVKQRFNNDIITKLLEIKWWNWPEEKIRQNILKLCSDRIEEFVSDH